MKRTETLLMDQYFDEEKRALQRSLDSFVQRAERDLDLPSLRPWEVAQRKKTVIDALLRIRGKVQLQHEESLRKQQAALVMAADNSLRAETEQTRTTFFAQQRQSAAELYTQRVVKSLSVDTAPPTSSSFLPLPRDSTANLAVIDDADFTISQLRRMMEAYKARKKEKAFSAMNTELQSLFSQTTNESGFASKKQAVQMNLQRDLQQIMDASAEQEMSSWRKQSLDDKSLRPLLSIYRRNMQIAAQICVLQELLH